MRIGARARSRIMRTAPSIHARCSSPPRAQTNIDRRDGNSLAQSTCTRPVRAATRPTLPHAPGPHAPRAWQRALPTSSAQLERSRSRSRHGSSRERGSAATARRCVQCTRCPCAAVSTAEPRPCCLHRSCPRRCCRHRRYHRHHRRRNSCCRRRGRRSPPPPQLVEWADQRSLQHAPRRCARTGNGELASARHEKQTVHAQAA